MKTTALSLAASLALALNAWGATQEFTIAIGDTVGLGKPGSGAGQIEEPGDKDLYHFAVDAEIKVYFDQLSGSADLRWRLLSPSNEELFNADLSADLGERTLSDTGTYTIEVAGQANATGTYSLRPRAFGPTLFSIDIGDTVSNGTPAPSAGNLETAGTTDAYIFPVTAGTKVFFDLISVTGNLSWKLVAPSGAVLFDQPYYYGDPGLLELSATGTYRLEWYGGPQSYGPYSFSLGDLRPPTPGNDVAGTTKGKAVELAIARLMANDSDPRGNPLTFSLTSGTTSQGGTVAVVGSVVRYTPPPTLVGTDTFTYTVDDGQGHAATATVTVNVRRVEDLGHNTIAATRNPDGSIALEMAGIPGRTYQVWHAADAVVGPWALLTTQVATANGVVSYVDTSAVGAPVRFYRLAEQP